MVVQSDQRPHLCSGDNTVDSNTRTLSVSVSASVPVSLSLSISGGGRSGCVS